MYEWDMNVIEDNMRTNNIAEEKEVNINFHRDDNWATVYCSDDKYFRHIRVRLYELLNLSKAKIIHTDDYGIKFMLPAEELVKYYDRARR